MSGSHAKRLLTSWNTMRALKKAINFAKDNSGPKYSLDASVAIRSKISLTKEFKIAIALFEIPVSGCTCLSTIERGQTRLTVTRIDDIPL